MIYKGWYSVVKFHTVIIEIFYLVNDIALSKFPLETSVSISYKSLKFEENSKLGQISLEINTNDLENI